MERTKQRRAIRSGLAATVVVALQIAAVNHLAAQANLWCPAYSVQGVNLAQNPTFDTVGPCGTSTWYAQGMSGCPQSPSASAAAGWTMHTSNNLDYISTQMVPSTLCIGGGSRMLHVMQRAGNEGGIYQPLPANLTKVMVSAWVYVRRGHIELQAQGGTAGPVSWNTKYNEWELLRVCVYSTPANLVVIYNQDLNGADFDVDRVEVNVIN